MAKTSGDDDLSPSELLESIIGLKQENSHVKKQLAQMRAELKALKAELADLGKAFKFEVDDVTANFKHDRNVFKQIYQYIADIHDQLWPLVHKVFPGSAKLRSKSP